MELFETDEELAFGDTTIAASMKREGIQYLYSFDDDFDTLDGITRLETADNPFRSTTPPYFARLDGLARGGWGLSVNSASNPSG